jgi:hypothetical protein
MQENLFKNKNNFSFLFKGKKKYNKKLLKTN